MLCLVLMWVCVAISAILISFSMLGPFFPHPHLFAVMLCSFALLTVSLIFIRSQGRLVLLAAWVFLFACSLLWWRTTDEKTVPWFLYQNCPPLAFLLVSHSRWLLTTKVNKTLNEVAP